MHFPKKLVYLHTLYIVNLTEAINAETIRVIQLSMVSTVHLFVLVYKLRTYYTNLWVHNKILYHT